MSENSTTTEGIDTVRSSVTYTISDADVENLVLTSGTINGTGNSSNNSITGNSSVNVLTGAGGNDFLDGSSGADTMVGGLGDDILVVDNASDVVTEAASEGTDTVQSSITFSISSLGNVENITLTGSGTINATGNTGNNVLRGDMNSAANTLTGGSGDDTFYVDASDVVSEAASGGTDTVYSAVSYTITDAQVENLTLTGSSNVNATGNSSVNTLTGNSGNNTLDGSTGNDTMAGGLGDDVYVANVATDTIIENASEGTDTIRAAVTFSIASLGNIENLVMTGTGTATGNSGKNVIDGSQSASANVLVGGADDDTYIVGTGDTVSENSSEGTDTVQSAVTYTITDADVENLTLTGAANVDGTGNASNNTITGNSGNNELDGSGGTDRLVGGAGDDTYVVDSTGDTLVENSSEGNDTVSSSVTFDLTSIANIENITLTGSSAINATGNSLNNTLTGNSGNNSLVGGTGNDVYVIGSGDTVIENSGEGTDEVQAGATYTLGSYLENLLLTGSSGIHGTGNTLDNIITGNSGANSLSGSDGADTLYGAGGVDTLVGGIGNDTLQGDAGNDTLTGGTGDDLYIVDSASDVLNENTGEGIDTVQSAITFSLNTGNRVYIENITFTGSSNVSSTLNDLDNVITGNSGNNSVSAGLGNDTYILGSGGSDTINETISGGGTDTLWLTGGFTINDITTSQSSLNGIVSYNGGDQVTLTNIYFTGTNHNNYNIETIKFDDGFFTTLMDNLSWDSGDGNANTKTGTSGHDVIIGKAGADTLDGAGGDDDIHGGSDNDVVKGGSGTDLLHGGTGNDSLYGQDGLDTMFGGTGLDTFVFEAATAYNNIDVIQDFNVLTDDDVLDLRDLLSGYNPGSHTLTDFVKVEDSGSDSIVSIDRDGTGVTYGWSQVATLKGITGLTDEAALVSGGNLLAA